MDEFTLTLSSPITEEQWDAITDVDFDYTDRICFNTKHGKQVEFVKRKCGKWIGLKCDQCGQIDMSKPNFCPNCGARMEV